MIILGSKSPRRKEILEMANIPFRVIVSNADEDIKCNDYKIYPMLTAEKKALDIINNNEISADDIILTADTIVYINGHILGKPKDKDDAYHMIKEISGTSHSVVTGVYLGKGDCHKSFYVETYVYVSPLTEEEILDYINTTEPYDKAGAYAIQGIFGKYINKIDGDYYNVMGLPINTIYEKIKEYL